MPSYAAFLRAINLGAVRRFANPEIVAATEAAGCTDVVARGGTGNVRLTSPRRSVAGVAADLERAYLADRGFAVPTVVLTLPELVDVVAVGEGLAAERPWADRHSVTLLAVTPDADLAADAEALSGDQGDVVVRGRAVHLFSRTVADGGPVGGAVGGDGVERRLGTGTNRTHRVLADLAARWA